MVTLEEYLKFRFSTKAMTVQYRIKRLRAGEGAGVLYRMACRSLRRTCRLKKTFKKHQKQIQERISPCFMLVWLAKIARYSTVECVWTPNTLCWKLQRNGNISSAPPACRSWRLQGFLKPQYPSPAFGKLTRIVTAEG